MVERTIESECEELREQLWAWHDGAAERAEEVVAHLGRCGACRERLAAYQSSARVLQSRMSVTVPAGLWEQVAHRAVTRNRPQATAFRLAAGFIAFLVYLLLGLLIEGRASSGSSVVTVPEASLAHRLRHAAELLRVPRGGPDPIHDAPESVLLRQLRGERGRKR